jgi:putative hydrolase of the HAD superfamily
MHALLFDLDNTLYPAERELFSLIDVRINRFMIEVVGIPEVEVDQLRRDYWQRYGASLQGLIRHYGIDPEAYLDFVHEVDVASRIEADPELRRVLQQLPQRKVVFTNGSRGHALRVLDSLEITDLFEEIFDIRVARYLPKPFAAPYEAVLEAIGVPARGCIMVEDSLANLRTAKELGMGTILVGQSPSAPYVDAWIPRADQVQQALAHWPTAAGVTPVQETNWP